MRPHRSVPTPTERSVALASARPGSLQRLALLLLTLALAGFGPAAAQIVPGVDVPSGPTGLTGDDAEALANEAVQTWLEQDPAPLADLSRMDAEQVCETLPGLFAAPPPPEGTFVDLDDRRERSTDDPDLRRFTYAAEVPPSRLMVVEASVRRDADGEGWTVDRVGFQSDGSTGRPWLQTREAGVGFLLFTVLVALGLWRSGPMRRWVANGVAAVREHRRLVAWTMIAGWALVGLGLTTGAQLPDACEQAVVTILSDTLDTLGATQALASGDVSRAAAVIFYQNFVVVSLTALFGSSLLLGLPVYLLAGVSFFAQTVAFGVLGLGSGPQLAFVAVLFVLEFTAYFLVVAGGGMILGGLIRGGLTGLGHGYRKAFSLLPLVALILLVGAWYEAALLML
ncbi:MAG: hypothetical protein WD336_02050 [Trueperaceae bacterium]